MMNRPQMWQELVVTIGLSIFLALFSTLVMSYVSMAAVIGPWVAPVLVLVAMIILLPFIQGKIFKNSVAVVVASGSIGGIVATALGFSFPALFFLNQKLFNVWMNKPVEFCLTLTGLVLSAGSLGFVTAYIIKDYLIVHKGLKFPIGKLVYNMIYVEDQNLGIMKMMSGMSFSVMYNILLSRFGAAVTFLSSSALSMAPLLFAIGFVAGHVMALPLLVGMLSRLFVLDIVRSEFFSVITEYDFVIAFCSGIVISGVLMGLLSFGKSIAAFFNKRRRFKVADFFDLLNINRKTIGLFVVVLSICYFFLSFCQFSILQQLYLIVFAFFSAFYMSVVAGAIGLAQLGRFATFVMLPAMYLFDLSYFQIVIISTFVSICSGVTVDLLFGYKLADLADISYRKIVKYQIGGFVISACVVGVVFWFYINYFGLGSPELFAQKAQSRSLLIQMNMFDYSVVVFGVLYGFIIKYLGMSPLLVFGGIVMPPYMVSWLVVAGAFSYLVSSNEDYYPFFFGVYALHAVWMMGHAVYSCFG